MQRRTLLLAGALALAGCQTQKSTTPLEDELAAARREGLLTDWSQLKLPAVPDNQNAALVYQEADRIYKALPKAQTQADTALYEAAIQRKVFTPAAPMLAHQAALLTLAEKAAALPDYSMPRDWSKGLDVPLPELVTVRQLTRLLCLRARIASEASKPLDALQDIARAARVGAHLGKEPLLFGALTQIACLDIADRIFVEVLQRHGSRADVLTAARATLPAFGPIPDPKFVYQFELPGVRLAVEQTRKGQPNLLFGADAEKKEASRNVLADLRRDPTILDRWELNLVRYSRELYQEFARNELTQLSARLGTIEKHYDARQNRDNTLAYIIAPALTKAAGRIQKTAAQVLLREQLVSLLEARQKTGAFPTKPTLPTDPFSDQPLRYQQSAQGFVLYSLGENGKDDGGSMEKDEDKSTKDLVIRYGRDVF